MQIIVRLSDKLVQYSGEGFSFAPYLIGPTFMDSNATPETHEIVEATLPVGYADGSFTYDGTFTPTPEYAAQAAQAAKDTHNAALQVQLDALDIKRIRPTAEGDTAYLATLNAQAISLRGQWQK